MAVQRTLQLLKLTAGNEKTTQNIGYINPSATAAVCKGFCQQALALTTDSYIDAYKIDKESLNEATAG